MDAIRYFRGMGRARRRSTERWVFTAFFLLLTALTVLAAIQEFG